MIIINKDSTYNFVHIAFRGNDFKYNLILTDEKSYTKLESQLEHITKAELTRQDYLILKDLENENARNKIFSMGALEDFTNHTLNEYIPKEYLGDRWHHRDNYFTQNPMEFGEKCYMVQSFNVTGHDIIGKLAKVINPKTRESYTHLLVTL